MNCVDNKNKECCGKNSNCINWSSKVLKMDHHLRSEVGIEDASDVEEVLLSIQVKGSEPLEPAFIRSEDEIFLDVFVLGSSGVKPTAVLKKDIQSIGVVGGRMPEEEEELEEAPIAEEVSSKEDFLNLYC